MKSFRPLLLAACLLLPLTVDAGEIVWLGELGLGRAALLQVTGEPTPGKFSGTINDSPFPVSDDGYALTALDMHAKPGKRTLKIFRADPDGKNRKLVAKTEIAIGKRKYKEERITLPKKKVDLGKKDLSRAVKETKSIKKTYARRGGEIGFKAGFQQPLKGRISGVFGSRRILNGKPRRPHNGTDIAAPKGTPVLPIAPGTVALVGKDYFFTGNTVILDHGQGTISLYAHMDKVHVKPGDWVAADAPIGAVGMTGRATGPHLHYGVLVRGMRVDPLLLPGVAEAGKNGG